MPRLPLEARQAPGTTIYSYAATDSSAATTTASSAAAASSSANGNTGGGAPSSSLYLFTFLITIVVLGLISAGLLFRAYYMRRQFHRRVQEAIQNGRPIPTDGGNGLGLNGRRGKKEKNVGPMPVLWEAEMWRDGERWEVRDEYENYEADDDGAEKGGSWDDCTPLSIVNLTPKEAIPESDTTNTPPPPSPTSPTARLRAILSTRANNAALRPTLSNSHRQPTTQSISQLQSQYQNPNTSAYTIPSEGDDVVVGVMIAMPVDGAAEERWNLLHEGGENDEERDVPEVCLGVFNAKIGGL